VDLEACLKRIREREPEIRAWVEVSPQPPLGEGPLGGVPFGAKDIFETQGLATEYGSPIYKGRKGERDAALVRDLRRRGAILVGKTVTTAFAYFDPGPTRNPRNPAHTPGGSSSGSAAAVAAGMVQFALGSQTQGSVIRPASFCGVVGFKPTYRLLPLDGVLPFAPSLDTAGLFTPTAKEMRTLWDGMGFRVGEPPARRLGAPRDLPPLEPVMEKAFRAAAAGLGAEAVELPRGFWELHSVVRVINNYEGARTHRERRAQYGDRIGRRLAQLVEEGLGIPERDYRDALAALGRWRQQMTEVFREFPVILSPAAGGPAPKGLESTGDPRMNSPWTGLGVPAISIPLPVEAGLPLGLQLTADSGHDGMLLETAVKSADGLGF